MNQSVQKHPIEIIMLRYKYKNKFEINNDNVLDTLKKTRRIFNQHNGYVSFEKKILFKTQSVVGGGRGVPEIVETEIFRAKTETV